MANTQSTEKKQSAKQKKILVASILLAATITAGSTFAWFTSKDEVTNRLSASAEYGVAIAESFQPPENWVPGQEINKDASAVNTGNVDAFVRMWLTGSMRLLQQNTTGSGTQIAGYDETNKNFGTAPTTAVTDSSLLNAGLTLMDDSGNYYKTLSATQAQNAHLTYEGTHEGYPDNRKTAYSEIQSMQSGILAYAPDNAEYTYILNEETELPIYVKIGSSTTAEYKKIAVPAGTLVHVGGTVGTAATYDTSSGTLSITAKEQVTNASGTGAANQYNTVYVAAQAHDDTNTFFVPQDIEYETFTPLTDGLYLFLRNENTANQADPEFSGYYRKTQNISNPNDNTLTGTNNMTVYYALNTDTQRANRSDYTVKGAETPTYAAPVTVKYDDNTNKKNIVHVVPSANLELYTAQYSNVNDLKFYADSNTNTQKIYAIYDKSGDNSFTPEEDIAVEINLANVGTDAEQWTSIGATALTNNKYTLKTGTTIDNDATNLKFYYNNDVEAGDSTAKLVDTVKLYEGVTNNAYLAFDFDLNVHLESVQVTFDENGKELDTAINSGAVWSGANGGATGSAQYGTIDTNEIASIKWTNP